MKVLFVSEGPNDVGPSVFAAAEHPARGTLPVLARRIHAEISPASVGIYWREVPVLPPRGRTARGFAAKVRSLGALVKKYDCEAIVCVADRDNDVSRDGTRLEAMREGTAQVADYPIAYGIAIMAIEAWTLGAPTALAEVLGIDEQQLRQHYRPEDVETLSASSGKEEKQPKKILKRLAALKHGAADTEMREDVAERTDLAELERYCNKGFKPFAVQLRAAFGPRRASNEELP